MLDIVRHIAQIWDGEHRPADHIFIVHQSAVLGIVGIALGAEADHRRILLVRDNAHHTVGRHSGLIHHEGDGLPLLDGIGVHLFDIDQGAGMVGRLHRAGQHHKYL